MTNNTLTPTERTWERLDKWYQLYQLYLERIATLEDMLGFMKQRKAF